MPAGAWFSDVVNRAVSLGFFSGYPDGRFGSNDRITRAQVTVALWNTAGNPAPGANAKRFSDVMERMYYTDAIAWASGAGVVNGYADGRFGPDDPVTREQLAAMLANYARKIAGKPTNGSAADFQAMKDAAKVSGWAVSSVGWCFQQHIISGTQDGYVNPQGDGTRAEAAKMFVMLHDLL